MAQTREDEDAELRALREHLDTGVVDRMKQLEWGCQTAAAYYKGVRMGLPNAALDELLSVSVIALDKAGFTL